ncbi:4-phosphopantetheinyl transferase [Bacillus toyonensis]|uniref:4'-phosphopantetheinyl transferase family protein n=1 Tax=Bacillus toyonensis TaxID=155322 RepID=UPI000BF6B335|nr:4'-phosphopantetheinyl transferase superfamily protein [Bacillus toyonensis]PFY18315.1 4-phosphopantetheinyl transferase [Bacillus toyonensis]
MIEIYIVKIPAKIENKFFQQLLQCVSNEKRKKIQSFRRMEDAYRALIADLLVRNLIIRKYNVLNEEIEFQNNFYGKPYLQGFSKFEFNISHSGEWVVCAVDKFSIGVDIEMIKPIEFDIAKCFFTEEEYDDLLTVDSLKRLDYFYDLWTIKESYVKAIGKGLTIPLNSFLVKKQGLEHIEIIQNNKKNSYIVKQYCIDDQYKLSVCAMHNKFPAYPQRIDFTTISQEMLNKNVLF